MATAGEHCSPNHSANRCQGSFCVLSEEASGHCVTVLCPVLPGQIAHFTVSGRGMGSPRGSPDHSPEGSSSPCLQPSVRPDGNKAMPRPAEKAGEVKSQRHPPKLSWRQPKSKKATQLWAAPLIPRSLTPKAR